MSSPPRRLTNERGSNAEDPKELPLDQVTRPKCRICRESHALRVCPVFRKMKPQQRLQAVKRHRYCLNCLAHSHFVKECRSRERCYECLLEHHTMLHIHNSGRNTANKRGRDEKKKPTKRRARKNSERRSIPRAQADGSNRRNDPQRDNRNPDAYNELNTNNGNGGTSSRGSNPMFVFHFH